MIFKILSFGFFLLNTLFVTGKEISVDFNTKPDNCTVTEGEDAYFTCIGKFDGESVDLSITWLRNDVLLSDLYQDGKYTIQSSSQNVALLFVKKVSRTDSSYAFTCVILKDEQIITRTLPVYLTIIQVPSNVYPECAMKTVELVEGKSALASCRVERINPEPKLKWFRQEQEVPLVEVQSTKIYESNFIILEHKFTPKMSDNGNVLLCSVTTPAKANYVSNCSTGALNVDYKPRVNITGPREVAVGEEVLFVCVIQAKPAIHSIKWNFYPPLPAPSYVLESNDFVLRIFKVQLKENGTKLKCTVSNTVGTNSFELPLVVKDMLIRDLKPTSSPKHTNVGKNYEEKSQNMDSALIISIAGCTLLLTTLLITMILCYHRICHIHRQTLSMAGEQIAQPQVYFEPKDMISPMPQPDYNHYIWRTVGIQVPSDGEIDSVYSEIDEGKKKITPLKSISV